MFVIICTKECLKRLPLIVVKIHSMICDDECAMDTSLLFNFFIHFLCMHTSKKINSITTIAYDNKQRRRSRRLQQQ